MTIVTYALGLLSFVALLVWQARDLKLGLLTCGGFIAGMLIFMLISWLLLRAFRMLPIPVQWHSWRFAQTSLKRRPAASALQIVALSLGLMALLLLTLVRDDLLSAWRKSTPPDAPNHFIINIQSDQQQPLTDRLVASGVNDVSLQPMIRGRLIQVSGKDIQSDSYHRLPIERKAEA